MFQRLTFENTCILILGFDPHCLSIEFPKVAYKKAFEDIEETICQRHFQPESWWKLKSWLQIGGEKKLTKSLKVFDDITYQCIASKRRELTSGTQIQKDDEANSLDALTSYLKQEEKQKQMGSITSSDQFLRDTILNLVLAGAGTLSAGLTWFFWLVATHPTVETKILEEIKLNLIEKQDEKGRFFNSNEVNKLVYLHAALCETLRLYPPAPINHRSSSEEDILPSGHRMKPKQRILLFFYSMGRMEDIWGEDCLEFKPERWINSDGGGIIKVSPYKFTAFNGGPQSCLGKNMSFIEMKMVAATMLWNYRVEIMEGHPISPTISITLYMKHGLKVRISQRDVVDH